MANRGWGGRVSGPRYNCFIRPPMKLLSARFLRRKLAAYGLFPNTVAGQITLYLLSLFLVLFVMRQLMLVTGRYGRASELSGWVFGIGFITSIFLFFIFLRWVRQVLMWRLRNRLMITYIFIGLIPVVLVAVMAGMAARLFSGQFAALEANNDLQPDHHGASRNGASTGGRPGKTGTANNRNAFPEPDGSSLSGS
jgi:hypothetical protein